MICRSCRDGAERPVVGPEVEVDELDRRFELLQGRRLLLQLFEAEPAGEHGAHVIGDPHEVEGGGQQLEDVLLDRGVVGLALGGVEHDGGCIGIGANDLGAGGCEARPTAPGQHQDHHRPSGREIEVVHDQPGRIEPAGHLDRAIVVRRRPDGDVDLPRIPHESPSPFVLHDEQTALRSLSVRQGVSLYRAAGASGQKCGESEACRAPSKDRPPTHGTRCCCLQPFAAERPSRCCLIAGRPALRGALLGSGRAGTFRAPVAQRIERRFPKPCVGGSSPPGAPAASKRARERQVASPPPRARSPRPDRADR